MKIVMEKYHGFGNDYLIWDPTKNTMQLDSKRVKEINKSNLGVGTQGILYGPIYEEDKMNFIYYNLNGSEANITENSAKVFLKYIDSNGYMSSETNNKRIACMDILQGNQYNIDEIQNIGFVILNKQFVEDLQVI